MRAWHGIRRVASNACRGQRQRVCPGGVTPFVDNQCRPIRDNCIELSRGGPGIAEGRCQKPRPQQWILIGVGAGVLRDRHQHFLSALIRAELYPVDQGQCVHTVDVRINKPREDNSATKLDKPRIGADVTGRSVAIANPNQPVSLNGQRGVVAGSRIHRVNLATPQYPICVSAGNRRNTIQQRTRAPVDLLHSSLPYRNNRPTRITRSSARRVPFVL